MMGIPRKPPAAIMQINGNEISGFGNPCPECGQRARVKCNPGYMLQITTAKEKNLL